MVKSVNQIIKIGLISFLQICLFLKLCWAQESLSKMANNGVVYSNDFNAEKSIFKPDGI